MLSAVVKDMVAVCRRAVHRSVRCCSGGHPAIGG
jgi:hypothetical protein